jgi:hypothetical protein
MLVFNSRWRKIGLIVVGDLFLICCDFGSMALLLLVRVILREFILMLRLVKTVDLATGRGLARIKQA